MKKRFLSKKGKPPPSSRQGREQSGAEAESRRKEGRKTKADGMFERRNSIKKAEAEQRAEYQSRAERHTAKTARTHIGTFIFHWKLFPSNDIARLK